ncbi:MAG: hydroxymethylglutaryl-CoA reductase, degradative [Myxococcales bacterium]|jgi:hydroxymethylglutaryl-CoA reductase|nr:hydroxymethylglutaryl-CoA reductase, degradative [Myxococcales bacterium]
MEKEGFSSRLPGFYEMSWEERLSRLAELRGLTSEEIESLGQTSGLSIALADKLVENAIGTLGMPMGLGLNFRVNGRDYLVPMVVEEPSVIAAASFAAKLARAGGGFQADADDALMVAQIQVASIPDIERARAAILNAREELLALAYSFHPAMVTRGGGARDVEVRVLDAPEGPGGEPVFVVQILIDVQDAMGANLVNTVAEGVAPLVESLTGGKVWLRILTNLADHRCARATCAIPIERLATRERTGLEVAQGVLQADRFAAADPYRAATHNKGVMNGIDAVALATGNDWRAIEAGAHAFASRNGRYAPLTRWFIDGESLVGTIELPLAVATVGGATKVHPHVRTAFKILGITRAKELACVMASVGLAQNFAALRALGSVGIQKGHMALHARCVAVEAGARGELIEKISALLVASGEIKVEKAKWFLGHGRNAAASSSVS